MNQQRISSSISQEEWINISSKKRFHPEQKMVTELDLHGYTKEKAVSTTTWFLDDAMKKAKIRKESPVFVTIITGTGKHSHCGPVLRNAIKALLEKRQMNFKLNHGKGSFTVDVTSGHQLFLDHQHRFDSKVVLTSDPPHQLPIGYGSNDKSSMIGSLATVVSGTSTTTRRNIIKDNNNNNNNEEASLFIHDNSPLPSEVSADDALFQHVKQVSSSEAAKIQSLKDREKNELEKAKTLSLVEDNKTTQNFCSQQLEEALRLSQMEQKSIVKEENELLEKALLLSSEQSDHNNNWSHENEDEMIKKALALSSSEHAPIYCSQSHEELEIKKAIELSLQQT